MPKRLVIVGGGIAGLSAAWYAEREAEKAGVPVEITLLEAGDRLGGKIVTRRADGFVMEGGPDSFLTEKPWGLNLCRELGLDEQLLPCNEEGREFYILRGKKFHRFPAGMRLFVPQQIPPLLASGLVSWPGKLRMMLEPFIKARAGEEDESLTSFVTRRCGKEALERLAAPILAGIYAADPDRLSMAAGFPNLVALERKYGSLTNGFRILAKERKGAAGPVFTSLRGGMGSLVEALASRLRAEIRLQQPARRLAVRGGQYEIATDAGVLAADALVLAQPANAAAGLAATFHSGLAQLLGTLPFRSSLTVSLGYRQADLPHGRRPSGFGYMIPRVEKQKLLGCTWASNKFPLRSDEGLFLSRLFVAGDQAEEWSRAGDAELVEAARAESDRLTGIRATPVATWVTRWDKGNPQYETGHNAWVKKVEAECARLPGLFVTGSSYRGLSMSDCVKDATTTAVSAVRFLAGA